MTRIGVTGHQRLPAAAADFARDGLRRMLAGMDGVVGVTALAEGADQLFAHAVLEAGGTLHVIVPAAGYDGTFADDAARREYHRLLAKAAAVDKLEFDEPGEPAYMAAGEWIVDRSDRLVAVWDGLPSRGLGGTGDVVEYARAQGKPVDILWPRGVSRD